MRKRGDGQGRQQHQLSQEEEFSAFYFFTKTWPREQRGYAIEQNDSRRRRAGLFSSMKSETFHPRVKLLSCAYCRSENSNAWEAIISAALPHRRDGPVLQVVAKTPETKKM
jgi:hypothetical protein